MLVPCLIGITLCSAPNHMLGVLVGPLERAFGWSRAEISSGPFIIAMVGLVAGPFAGMLADRLGPRRIALSGIPFFCAALALVSLASASIWSWWVLWALVGIAAVAIFPALWTSAIASLFVRNRGKALAIALCGTGVSAAFMPPLTNMLVEDHGWRGAYVGMGLLLLVIALPPTFLLFRSAHDRRGRAEEAALPGVSARAGFASWRFARLAVAATLFNFTITGLTANQVPILIGAGLSPGPAAAVAGLMGIGAIIGRLAGGVLLDRFDAKKVAAISVLTPCVTAVLLLAFPGSVEAAMAASLVLGLAFGTELDACTYLAARHFGLHSLTTLFGTINGLVIFASGVGPVVANHIFDVTRSYQPYLWLVLPGLAVTATLFLALGRYPDFD
jgi:MFS family permease